MILKKESKESLIRKIYIERIKVTHAKQREEKKLQAFKLAVRQLKKVRNQLNSIINTYERRR